MHEISDLYLKISSDLFLLFSFIVYFRYPSHYPMVLVLQTENLDILFHIYQRLVDNIMRLRAWRVVFETRHLTALLPIN